MIQLLQALFSTMRFEQQPMRQDKSTRPAADVVKLESESASPPTPSEIQSKTTTRSRTKHDIDGDIKRLGAERIRRNGYIEANLRNELVNAQRISGVCLNLKEGQVYSNTDIKSIIQAEYDRLGMNKTAKATDIFEFADAKESKIRINCKRVYGYKILKVY